jgi:hypothetical protein
MMQSPLAASLEWFDRQPGEVQETVAFLVGTLVMDMLLIATKRWLGSGHGCRHLTTSSRELGTALHFRTLVEFMLQTWMTPDGQAVALQRLHYLRESALERSRMKPG